MQHANCSPHGPPASASLTTSCINPRMASACALPACVHDMHLYFTTYLHTLVALYQQRTRFRVGARVAARSAIVEVAHITKHTLTV
eukprot:3402825-Amphidinium_carterae.1